MADRTIETDVLVVGGGGAGFRAAIGARERDARALLVSKGPIARCGATPLAGADITCDGKTLFDLGYKGERRDTKQTFFEDIVTQGFCLNNQRLLELYVEQAPARVKELLDWGLKVTASEDRAIITSGVYIMDTLLARAKACGVDLLGDVMVLDLLARDGKVVGALGLDVKRGDFITFQAGAVVLASGGWHKAYWPNTGTRELTGEGQAMAYRAGATLANLEFVTFAANILLWPPRWAGSLFTYILHLIAGGKLADASGNDIRDGFDPLVRKTGSSMEWNKSFITIATANAVRAGKGSPHGGVFYQVGDIPWDDFDHFGLDSGFFQQWRYKNADYSDLRGLFKRGEPVEVGPAVEYFEGGVAVDERFSSGVPGLYAAGECAVSLFGANRVAAATTEMLVAGTIAGRNAGELAKTATHPGIDPRQQRELTEAALRPLTRDGGVRPSELRRLVQRTAHQQLGPVRDAEILERFIEFVRKSRSGAFQELSTSAKTRLYNKEWIESLELQNVLTMLELSSQAALARTESRGVHFRSDFPQTDNDSWLKEITLSRDGDQSRLSTRPLALTGYRPQPGVTPYFEMMKQMMAAHSFVGGHH